jgi:hypothetical protein
MALAAARPRRRRCLMDDPQVVETKPTLAFEQFATVNAYTMPFEADIARSVLEAEEIRVYLMDYHTIYIDWLYSNALGGVKLQVHKDDITLAREIIEHALHSGQEEDYSEGACPVCHSIKTAPVVLGRRWTVFVWLLFGIPLGWQWIRLRCSSCGHTWRDKNEPSTAG